jgi:hypothetical protein
MARKTTMTLWYVVLALAVFASAGFMGLQIRERIRPDLAGDVSLHAIQPDRATSSDQPTPNIQNAEADQQRIAMIFRGTKVFQPLVTPKPTPTREPLPTATPTPPQLAEHYKIRTIMGSSAILIDYRLMPVSVRVGTVVKDPLGEFKVEEVDAAKQAVRVRLTSTGYERWITDKEPSKAPQPAQPPQGQQAPRKK